jgi:hypothetical protein
MHYKVRHYKITHEDETQSTKSLIEFRVTSSMFRSGRLNLRCTASISDVYRKSADIGITEDVPRIASITGESLPYDHRKYPSNSSPILRPYFRPRRSLARAIAFVSDTLIARLAF